MGSTVITAYYSYKHGEALTAFDNLFERCQPNQKDTQDFWRSYKFLEIEKLNVREPVYKFIATVEHVAGKNHNRRIFESI